jgi:hypothetical protein
MDTDVNPDPFPAFHARDDAMQPYTYARHIEAAA